MLKANDFIIITLVYYLFYGMISNKNKKCKSFDFSGLYSPIYIVYGKYIIIKIGEICLKNNSLAL